MGAHCARRERALQLAIAARHASAGGLLPAEQIRWLDEGLEAEAEVSPKTRARALHAAGGIANLLGDFTKSVSLAEQSLGLFRELGDDPAAIETLVVLGNATRDSGDYERARALCDEALALAKRVSYERGTYRALHALGEIERAAGNLARATEFLERSAALARNAGDRVLLPFILHGLGDLALAQRNLSSAASFYRQGLRLGQEIEMGRPIVACVAGLAVVAAVAREVARAGRLWGALEILEHKTGTPARGRHTPWYDDIITSCSDAAPIVFAAAAEDGRRMTPDDITEYALDDASG